MPTNHIDFLKNLFQIAISRANPLSCVPPHLPHYPKGKTIVIGAGKASASMAQAVESKWQKPLSGIVVTRYGYSLPCSKIKVIEAGHPIPDETSQNASREIITLATELGPQDLCIALISGGASSLLSLPIKGINLKDKQDLYQKLLYSGAAIGEINIVRKHLSAIKGGRLAEAIFPAKLHTILISDVPGDDPSTIGSGPTMPDPSTFFEAREILKKYTITPSASILKHLTQEFNETPKSGGKAFTNSEFCFASVPKDILEAAENFAKNSGLNTYLLGDSLQGEARFIARQHADLALKIKGGNGPVQPPCVILSGGETTVTIKGKGKGGPNSEYALALAINLKSAENIFALACDTDGIDGSEDNAGAFISPKTLEKASFASLDPNDHLNRNDSYSFFYNLNDLIKTGPTFTNVNDFRALLILP